jgi:dTDP-4-amino-4,6-dideoxygalactose transaminase
MTRVPVSDPKRSAVAQQAELQAAFERFLASGWYIHGPEHAAFEEDLAAFVGVAHCVGVASGTDALELAMLAVGCRPGTWPSSRPTAAAMRPAPRSGSV